MISGVVFEALKGLVPNAVSPVTWRCYPNTFMQPDGKLPVWPAIRYQLISSDNVPDICGTDTMDTDDTRVQVDGAAKTYGGMITLRDGIIAAMQATDPPCVRDGLFETYDDETKTHRVSLDFIFYASSQ